MELSGKVCVVAGAGGAIGEAVVTRLSSDGATVVGIDRRDVEVGVPTYRAELADETDVREVFAQIKREHGRIDVLYNNAGPLDPANEDHGLLETPAAVWTRVFTAVLTPVEMSCRFGIPLMEQGGSVINTGSFLAGMGAATSQMAFSAAKAAVVQLSRDLGVHLAKRGIRVNVLELGPVQSPETESMFRRLGPDGTERRLAHVPMGRFAQLREIAGAAAYLASDDSGYITASVFPVSGGIQNAYTIP